MAEAIKKEVINETERENLKVTKTNNKKDGKQIVQSTILKPSWQLTKDEVNKLQKFNVKLVKRFNRKYNSFSYLLFLNLSSHVKPSVRLTEADFYLILDELEKMKYMKEKIESKDTETLYISGVPIRFYEVLPNETNNRGYARFNVFLTENSIFSEYFKFSEQVLVKKENPEIKFIVVEQDTDLSEDNNQGDFIGW